MIKEKVSPVVVIMILGQATGVHLIFYSRTVLEKQTAKHKKHNYIEISVVYEGEHMYSLILYAQALYLTVQNSILTVTTSKTIYTSIDICIQYSMCKNTWTAIKATSTTYIFLSNNSNTSYLYSHNTNWMLIQKFCMCNIFQTDEIIYRTRNTGKPSCTHV